MVRHAVTLLAFGSALGMAALGISSLASKSPAAGVILVWTAEPQTLLAYLPGQVRIVNTWLDGRFVQLHVDSMREVPEHLRGAWVAVRLPGAGMTLAGCG